jgi:lysophospholipase L1-like esterase
MSLKRLLLILAVVGIIFGLFRWMRSGSGHFTNYPPAAAGPWIALGDSLTEGFGAEAGHDYPAVLGESLGVAIKNLGRSGETSAGGLARLDDVLQQRPRVVLLCLGGNDSLNGVPRTQTFANLGTIIERLQQAGAFVVLIGVRSASLRDHNAEFFAKLAREKQVFYIPDILQGLVFKPIYMSDAIHPNDEGYRRIAERLEMLLKPLLPKLRPPASGDAVWLFRELFEEARRPIA